jgi:hypothetical protein
LVTPFINFELEGGSKISFLVDTGNSAGLIISKMFYQKHLPHLTLDPATATLVDTAGAAPLKVLSEVEFEACVLSKGRGRVRFRAKVVQELRVDGYLSMREINALGADILTSEKEILMTAFTPPIALPLPTNKVDQILPATGISVSTSISSIYAVVQSPRFLELHSVSSVKFEVDERSAHRCATSCLDESSDKHFVSVVVDGNQVLVTRTAASCYRSPTT